MDQSIRFQQIQEDLHKNRKKIKISIDNSLQKASDNLKEEQSLRVRRTRFLNYKSYFPYFNYCIM